MMDDIEDHCRRCPSCQVSKYPTQKPAGTAKTLPIPTRPFESLALDFLGPLPKSEGYENVMTAVCRLSGMSFFVALPQNFGAKDAANGFMDYIYPFIGLPDSFVSDRDPRFCSHFWQQTCAHLGIELLMSSAFHQQTNGQLERLHRDIGAKL